MGQSEDVDRPLSRASLIMEAEALADELSERHTEQEPLSTTDQALLALTLAVLAVARGRSSQPVATWRTA